MTSPLFHRLIRVLLIVCSLCSLAFTRVDASDSIGFALGDGYAVHEASKIIDRVVKVHFSDLNYEESEFFLPQEYQRHRLVFLIGAPSERKYTPQETQQIEEYVEAGGRIVMIRQGPMVFPPPAPGVSHIFGVTYYHASALQSSVTVPEHPLLKEVFDVEVSPTWLQGNVFLKGDDWEALIGDEARILVGCKTYGKGRIYYLSAELFRMKDPADAEAWIALIKNILSES